jgi:predicted nuclease of predicted toxin-antitoxin system
MRFLVDECAGPSVARWLVSKGHDVFSVFDSARDISDMEILERAFAEERIIVTNDKVSESTCSDCGGTTLELFYSDWPTINQPR